MSSHQVTERFLKFLPSESNTGEYLAKIVLHFLEQQGIDINGVWGQSYSNASNMSGRYKGMQARIHYINPKAVYIPCATHSFNLVRICALLTVVLRQSIFME